MLHAYLTSLQSLAAQSGLPAFLPTRPHAKVPHRCMTSHHLPLSVTNFPTTSPPLPPRLTHRCIKTLPSFHLPSMWLPISQSCYPASPPRPGYPPVRHLALDLVRAALVLLYRVLRQLVRRARLLLYRLVTRLKDGPSQLLQGTTKRVILSKTKPTRNLQQSRSKRSHECV